MSQPLSDEEEEVNIAIAVSQLDGAGGSQICRCGAVG